MSFFKQVQEEPLDPIFGLNIKFVADPRPQKVNLGVGVYKTKDLKGCILNSVKHAEKILIEQEISKDYLSIDGSLDYILLTKQLIFRENASEFLYGAHTVGGTGPLALGALFLKELGMHKCFLSAPTWANHHRIFRDAGFEISTYPYFDEERRELNFSALIQSIEKMPEGSVILLQASCHNPTGFDPSEEEWQEIFFKIQQKKIFPFFDVPYQGFGESLEKDTAILSLFLKKGLECAIAVSHAKNFGLYAERPGALFFACQDLSAVTRVGSRIKAIIRGLYSNPPCHGARIVTTILQNPELKHEWKNELDGMRQRIIEMRNALSLALKSSFDSSAFDFLMKQKGMFSYTGLNRTQVECLIANYGIYLPSDGRINVAGLNSENLDYVVKSIRAVMSS